MMDTKLVVNGTNHGSTMKVGNRNYFTKLASVKIGGRYEMQVDIDWTYREFLLEVKADNKVYITSDNCCDFERNRMSLEGVGSQYKMRKFMTDPAHHCKNIPCSYCGRKWRQFPPSDD